ncbi:MAG: hypothetical protein ACRDTH_04990 [Pseudonocardiaceae bacterium]
MSADPVGEPVRRTDDDVLRRLAAIDQRLHQISIQLTSMDTLISNSTKPCVNFETLIGVARVGGSIVNAAFLVGTVP